MRSTDYSDEYQLLFVININIKVSNFETKSASFRPVTDQKTLMRRGLTCTAWYSYIFNYLLYFQWWFRRKGFYCQGYYKVDKHCYRPKTFWRDSKPPSIL